MRTFCLVSTGYLILDTFFKALYPHLSTIVDLDPLSSTNIELLREPKMVTVRGFTKEKNPPTCSLINLQILHFIPIWQSRDPNLHWHF
jgi:hypothetical protein